MVLQIGIMDYGVGNLHSIKKGLEQTGSKCIIVKNARKLFDHDCIVLPGVGAFGAALKRLEPVRDRIVSELKSKKPALCICIGMQILFEKSDEEPKVDGLSLLKGDVKKISQCTNDIKIPHMGWNSVHHNSDNIFQAINQDQEFYFVHSYICKPLKKETIIAETSYGETFASAIRYRNTIGLQFHPEKSTAPGLRILDNFVKLAGASI